MPLPHKFVRTLDESDLTAHQPLQLADLKKAGEGRVARLTRQADATLTKEVEHYQKQLKTRESEISQLESMHSAVKAQYEQRVLDLESTLAKTKDKLKQVRARLCTSGPGYCIRVVMRMQVLALRTLFLPMAIPC